MARNFVGPTSNKIAWTPPAAPPSTGCMAFFMKTTQTDSNTSPASYCDSSTKNGPTFLLNEGSNPNKILVIGNDATSERLRIISTTSVNGGTWRHVAFNYDRANGGANALFIDGTSEATGNSSAAWTYGSTGLTIALGRHPQGFWTSFSGDMANFGHWNAKLDAAEIAALAKGFSPRLIRPSALLEVAPLIRDTSEYRTGLAATVSGTTASDHPRVFE